MGDNGKGLSREKASRGAWASHLRIGLQLHRCKDLRCLKINLGETFPLYFGGGFLFFDLRVHVEVCVTNISQK